MSEYPLPAGDPQTHGLSASGISTIDAFFHREIEARRLPGAVLAIAREGRLLHHKAYGLRDPVAQVPMTLDTVFPLASMTKIMVSVAALKLMQAGHLPLRSRLDRWFPAFALSLITILRCPRSYSFTLTRPHHSHYSRRFLGHCCKYDAT